MASRRYEADTDESAVIAAAASARSRWLVTDTVRSPATAGLFTCHGMPVLGRYLSAGTSGGGAVPSPNGGPPSSSRPCGVCHTDKSGPAGTMAVGLISV